MKAWKIGAVLLCAAMFASCGGNSSSVTVTVTPNPVTVILSGSQQFTATVAGSSNTNVNLVRQHRSWREQHGGNHQQHGFVHRSGRVAESRDDHHYGHQRGEC